MKDAVLVVKFQMDDNIPSENLTDVIEAVSMHLGPDVGAQFWAGIDDAARKVLEQTTIDK